MTTETPEATLTLGIVACGTCDSVFRAHENRQTCPCCGGDPAFLIIDYSDQQQPLPPGETPPSPEGEAGPDLPADTPPAAQTLPADGPTADQGPAAGSDAPAVEEEGVTSSRRRRPRP